MCKNYVRARIKNVKFALTNFEWKSICTVWNKLPPEFCLIISRKVAIWLQARESCPSPFSYRSCLFGSTSL